MHPWTQDMANAISMVEAMRPRLCAFPTVWAPSGALAALALPWYGPKSLSRMVVITTDGFLIAILRSSILLAAASWMQTAPRSCLYQRRILAAFAPQRLKNSFARAALTIRIGTRIAVLEWLLFPNGPERTYIRKVHTERWRAQL